jgi:ABC-type multidrug transport system fused ATPase/permease subunit
VSISDNIRYGREDVTDEELVEAASQAMAHDFIKELPNVMCFIKMHTNEKFQQFGLIISGL